MNARTAIEINKELVNDLLTFSQEMATRMNISIEEAITRKVAIYVKYAKNSTEACAWEIRGEEALKLIAKI
jgi:hypothetical protein